MSQKWDARLIWVKFLAFLTSFSDLICLSKFEKEKKRTHEGSPSKDQHKEIVGLFNDKSIM